MFEGPSFERKVDIKTTLTDEQLKERVREGAAMSPEEKKAAARAYREELLEPTIKLTPEEMQAIEERKKREERRAA